MQLASNSLIAGTLQPYARSRQNRAMASALGISTRRVDSLAFAFAGGLAGVAGCILAHQYNVKYNMGADYIVEAFMVVILGGMGQLSGSVAGGAIIGSIIGAIAGGGKGAAIGAAAGAGAGAGSQMATRGRSVYIPAP